jgi:hypothetical protein
MWTFRNAIEPSIVHFYFSQFIIAFKMSEVNTGKITNKKINQKLYSFSISYIAIDLLYYFHILWKNNVFLTFIHIIYSTKLNIFHQIDRFIKPYRLGCTVWNQKGNCLLIVCVIVTTLFVPNLFNHSQISQNYSK